MAANHRLSAPASDVAAQGETGRDVSPAPSSASFPAAPPRSGASAQATLKTVEYSSNNSGGSWWLKDKDWIALEKAGWTVLWGGLWFCNSDYERGPKPATAPVEPCPNTLRNGRPWNECQGHRRYTSAAEAKAGERYLGALATAAIKGGFQSVADAIREWESITGLDATDEGCNCCGAPHSFSTKDGQYEGGSGEGLVAVLYGDDAPTTLREAVERLRK